MYKFLENPKQRIYGYLRLSKEDVDVTTGKINESCSISSQRMCIRQFISGNLKMDTREYEYEEILDDGFSGTNMERPGMSKLLRMVKEGMVDTIIVRDLSRFARNYIEVGYYLEFVFPTYNVRFIAIDDKFDSLALGETTGGFDLAIRNLVNALYSKDTSRKIKSTMNYKKLNGQYVYGAAPFGYTKGVEKNTIAIDYDAARIVRRIFEMAAEGVTISRIAKIFNDEKIVTPSIYLSNIRKNYRKYPHWTYESVRNIIRNRIYAGDTVPFKSHVVTVGSNKVRYIPAEEQEVVFSTHEAIVPREIFLKANSVIKTNKKSKPVKSQAILANLVVCGCCGKKLQKGRSTNKNYKCATARYVSDLDCNKIQLNEEQITEVILRAIDYQLKILDEKISSGMKGDTGIISDFDIVFSEKRILEKGISEIENLKMKSYEDYVHGAIAKEKFLKDKRALTEREEARKAQLKLLEARWKQLESEREQSAAAKHYISKYKDSKRLTPELLRELVQKIIAFPDGAIQVIWNFADYFVININEKNSRKICGNLEK